MGTSAPHSHASTHEPKGSSPRGNLPLSASFVEVMGDEMGLGGHRTSTHARNLRESLHHVSLKADCGQFPLVRVLEFVVHLGTCTAQQAARHKTQHTMILRPASCCTSSLQPIGSAFSKQPLAYLVEVQRHDTDNHVHAHEEDDADVQGEKQPSEGGAGLSDTFTRRKRTETSG